MVTVKGQRIYDTAKAQKVLVYEEYFWGELYCTWVLFKTPCGRFYKYQLDDDKETIYTNTFKRVPAWKAKRIARKEAPIVYGLHFRLKN